jgi:hypothetical protein
MPLAHKDVRIKFVDQEHNLDFVITYEPGLIASVPGIYGCDICQYEIALGKGQEFPHDGDEGHTHHGEH